MKWKRTVRELISQIMKDRRTIPSALNTLRLLITPKTSPRHQVTLHLTEQTLRALDSAKGVKITPLQVTNLSSEAQTLLRDKIEESVALISLDREKSIAETLSRFMGFTSALDPFTYSKTVRKGEKKVRKTEGEILRESRRKKIPVRDVPKFKTVPIYGKTKVNKVKPSKVDKIIEPAASLRYKERRVAIDQGHKLSSMIEESIAEAGHALGFVWRHHWSKHPRVEHEERDYHVYLYDTPEVRALIKEYGIKESKIRWAADLPTLPGREINCRCTARYLYTVQALRNAAPELFT